MRVGKQTRGARRFYYFWRWGVQRASNHGEQHVDQSEKHSFVVFSDLLCVKCDLPIGQSDRLKKELLVPLVLHEDAGVVHAMELHIGVLEEVVEGHSLGRDGDSSCKMGYQQSHDASYEAPTRMAEPQNAAAKAPVVQPPMPRPTVVAAAVGVGASKTPPTATAGTATSKIVISQKIICIVVHRRADFCFAPHGCHALLRPRPLPPPPLCSSRLFELPAHGANERFCSRTSLP